MKNREPWSFCETPEEKCTMNYCDENGCQNRKRNYVEGNYFIADVSSGTFNYNAMKEQTNGKVAIRRGCLNQQCFCTGACQEIVGWRDKLPNEH